ncbi:hypothetical protein Trydic_g14380 [Trypoxylus dichotomus]
MYILIQTSLVIYLVTSIDGFVSMTRTMSTFALGMQIMAKLNILYFRSGELKEIISTIKYEFWPSNGFGRNVEDLIRQESRSLLVRCIMPYVSAITFLAQISLAPLIKGDRALPYDSWYPFNWRSSPTYEIIYALQLYMTLFINGNAVCGTDFLYCSICANCTIQFRLLCKAIKQIGKGKERELTEYLLNIPGSEELGKEAFKSAWYNKDYKDIRQCLSILIKRTQKPVVMKALGLFELSYASFVLIMGLQTMADGPTPTCEKRQSGP